MVLKYASSSQKSIHHFITHKGFDNRRKGNGNNADGYHDRGANSLSWTIQRSIINTQPRDVGRQKFPVLPHPFGCLIEKPHI